MQLMEANRRYLEKGEEAKFTKQKKVACDERVRILDVGAFHLLRTKAG